MTFGKTALIFLAAVSLASSSLQAASPVPPL
jgi:hypothetical protein